jgi:thiol-disulfide isomerase/thioredoxin
MEKTALLLVILLSFLISVPPVSGEKGLDAPLLKGESRKGPEVLTLEGKKAAFSSFIGAKPLVVVFWASWCIDCQAEVPALKRLANDSTIRLLTVNVGEGEEKVRSFISRYKVSYEVVRDPAWQTTTAYRIVGVPSCIILDRSGTVLYRGSSLPPDIGAYLRK